MTGVDVDSLYFPLKLLYGLEMEIQVKTITPAQATKWLEHNHPRNRPINWARVESFVADIHRQAWILTHQGVCFDGEGQLIDGQHRLHAIAKAGKSVQMVVATNKDGTFESPIDRGQTRSLTMITGLSRRKIGAISVLRMMEQGYQTAVPVTMEDLEEFLGHHEEHFKVLECIKGYQKLYAGCLAAVVWSLPLNRQKVTEWTEAVITGEMLGSGHPALAYRRWLEARGALKPDSWKIAMVSLNSIRHFLTGNQLSRAFSGPAGYRAITAQRRKMRVPNTPTTALVPGLSFTPTKGEPIEAENG